MKRIIFYEWGANTDPIFKENLINEGFDLIVCNKECVNYTRDMALASQIMNLINSTNAEAVVSFNYFPIISMACDVCSVPYYSWVYDSPHIALWAQSVVLKSNRIGDFDRKKVESLNDAGICTIKHVPLSVDADYFSRAISRCGKDYSCDISFVGTLYKGGNNYYDNLHNDDEIWCEIDEVIESQLFDYKHDYVSSAVSDNSNGIFAYLSQRMIDSGNTLDDDFFDYSQGLVTNSIIGRKVSSLERIHLLEAIALKYGEGLCIYTSSSHDSLDAYIKGRVNYLDEMPSVFNQSKINLNVTVRSIQSGIPLRALDIMACGGFLLSNPQEELLDYFEKGKEFETFCGIEEALDKIAYYLNHDNERVKIAKAGYEKVKNVFNYSNGIQRLGLLR